MNEPLPPEGATLELRIEALLFALGETLSHTELARMLEVDEPAIERAIGELQQKASRERRGVVIVDDGKEVSLRAAKEAAELIENVRKEAYSRDIGKAGLEVLAAVLYQEPLTRSQIDFIRGVNSAQTVRGLAVRGLLRKVPNPKDERSFLYEPTTELLSQLGVSRAADLPEHEHIRAKLEKLRAQEDAGADPPSKDA